MEDSPKPYELYLRQPGMLLGEQGYEPYPERVEQTSDTIVFYHYTRREALARIIEGGKGLLASRTVACPAPPPSLANTYLVEGFLEPLPPWLHHSAYFGDLGITLLRAYVGDVLLRVEVPISYPGLYVADYAHILECKHVERRGAAALHLGFDCGTGHMCTQAYVHSYVPAVAYEGGHVAPLIQAVRKGCGIAVPASYISVAEMQPLLNGALPDGPSGIQGVAQRLRPNAGMPQLT